MENIRLEKEDLHAGKLVDRHGIEYDLNIADYSLSCGIRAGGVEQVWDLVVAADGGIFTREGEFDVSGMGGYEVVGISEALYNYLEN